MTNYDILKEYEAHKTPVPSYEEWQQMKAFCEGFNTLNVAEENQRLKELLKECRNYVVNTPIYPQGDNIKQAEIHRLVDKINEVLNVPNK